MKQKTHSGLKKRVKVRKSGKVMVRKSCKNHLLSNKSKRQKKSHGSGYAVNVTKIKAIRKLMPGKVKLQGKRVVKIVKEVAKKKVVKKVAEKKIAA